MREVVENRIVHKLWGNGEPIEVVVKERPEIRPENTVPTQSIGPLYGIRFPEWLMPTDEEVAE